MTDKKWIEDVEFLNYLKYSFTDPFYKCSLPCEIIMTNGIKHCGMFNLKDLIEFENSKVYMLDANVLVDKYSYKLNSSNIVSIKYSETLYRNLLYLGDFHYDNVLTTYELDGGDFSNINDDEIINIFKFYKKIYDEIKSSQKELLFDEIDAHTFFELSKNTISGVYYDRHVLNNSCINVYGKNLSTINALVKTIDLSLRLSFQNLKEGGSIKVMKDENVIYDFFICVDDFDNIKCDSKCCNFSYYDKLEPLVSYIEDSLDLFRR